MKNLNLVQFVCASVDHSCPMIAIHRTFLISYDRKPSTNN